MAVDTNALAERLYSRLPEIYRSQDLAVAQRALPGADETAVLGARPLLALVTAIATQVASLRQDMDDLWDNFFIETADDWVVPYIGALLGTNLLPNEVEQSRRLDVRNTVLWRRSKGTPAMLAKVAAATTGWRSDVVEFFGSELWVQNLRHLRLGRPLTAGLRDRFALSRLGHADDPFLHAPDLRLAPDPGRPATDPGLAGQATTGQPPTTAALGRPAGGTRGRYGLHNLGVFVRPLPTFRNAGVMPAPDPPEDAGGHPVTDPSLIVAYTFDPLGRDIPLFRALTGAPIERAQLDHQPDAYFGAGDDADLSVRRLGVPLAVPGGAPATPTRSTVPFKFAGNPNLRLHPTQGLRLLEPRLFGLAGQSFVVSAIWRPTDGSADVWLGGVSTLLTRLGRLAEALRVDPTGSGLDGQLVIRLEVADPSLGWPQLGPGRGGLFPATVLAVRDDLAIPRIVTGAVDSSYQDALFVYIPATLVMPEQPVELWVAADGATYRQQTMTVRGSLGRASDGQLWPAADLSHPALTPIPSRPAVHRRLGLAVADQSRFDPAAPVLIEACVDTGVEGSIPQEEGGLITGPLPGGVTPPAGYPAATWQPFEFHASTEALTDQLPESGNRVIRVTGLTVPGFCPQFEVVLTDRAGNALLCYLPETTFSGAATQQEYFIHEDGSSYLRPAPGDTQQRLARIGGGQALPIEGVYPLQRRLVRSGRPPAAGELGVDPERGRFSLAPGDPILDLAIDQRGLTVDYTEAFTDQVGARAYSRGVDVSLSPATRIVAAGGDADTTLPLTRIHSTIQDAVDHATDGEVIQIADSATYAESVAITMSASLGTLTLRAADEPLFMRPCVTSPSGPAIRVQGQPSSRLELSGLLIAGGGLEIPGQLSDLLVTACTFDVAAPGTISIAAGDEQEDHRSGFVICRCLLGAILAGQGVDRILVADSVIDNRGGLAVGGVLGPPGADAPARSVQLERVTVLGRVRCDSLVASESILTDTVFVDDRQAGCLRYSRFDAGSTGHLPRRFRCTTDPVSFVSLIQFRPGYAQVAGTSSETVLTATASGDVAGAFATARSRTRMANLAAKLREFMPVGLVPVVIVET